MASHVDDTMWLAGGGVRGGMVYGATDEFGWHAVRDKVHVHDLHATILHLMCFDHVPFSQPVPSSGRDFATWNLFHAA